MSEVPLYLTRGVYSTRHTRGDYLTREDRRKEPRPASQDYAEVYSRFMYVEPRFTGNPTIT